MIFKIICAIICQIIFKYIALFDICNSSLRQEAYDDLPLQTRRTGATKGLHAVLAVTWVHKR